MLNLLALKNFSNDPLLNKWTLLSGRLKCFEKIYSEIKNIFDQVPGEDWSNSYDNF
jgi:hypothetical protein